MDQEIVASDLPILAQPLQQFQQLLATGGPVLVVIASLSIIALAIILLKLVQFGRLGLDRRGSIDVALAIWHTGKGETALSVLAGTRNPIARTMEVAIHGKKDGTIERHDLEENVMRHGAAQVVSLRSYLRLLELIATLSPLLGLLGTVLGMIDAFQALEAAGSRVNPAILSGGIWVALLTTAAGLIVAIPAAAAHNIFEGIVERVAQSIEDAATQILVGSSCQTPAPALPKHEGPRLAAEMAS